MSKKLLAHESGFMQGIIKSIPASLAVAIFGFVFGFLAHTRGLHLPSATYMSAIVFAGAAQMVSIHIWSTKHLPLFSLIASCFIVCLRFALMSASLQPHFKTLKPWQVYLSLFFLIDENWAFTIIQSRNEKEPHYLFHFFLASGLLLYFLWVLSTILGFLSYQLIDDPNKFGLDFAFTALFLAILIGVWRDKRDWIPWMISAIVAILAAKYLPGNWYIILGALTGSIFGVLREYY